MRKERRERIVSSSPQGSGYDRLELKHQNLVFSIL